MAFLFHSQQKIVPEFTGLQIMTSVQVIPIPIIYGSPRVSVNLIYFNGFQAVMQSVGGGKKGGGAKGQQQELAYYASIILSIGEGPIYNILAVYQDQGVYTLDSYPSNGGAFFNGTPTQAPWDVVVQNWPVDARGYKDTAYLAFADAQLDLSATVPQLNVIASGIGVGTCPLYNSTLEITSGQYDQNGNPISYLGPLPLGDCDADPATCILDFLTNPVHGAGFPLNLVDQTTLFSSPSATNPAVGDAALQTYCQAVGFGWSLSIENAESANTLLERWTKNMVVAPVWNGQVLRFIPFYSSPVSTNPGYDPANPNGIPLKYYVPSIVPVVSLTIDYLSQASAQDEDPITYNRVDQLLTKNVVRVDFKDRFNFFNNNVEEAKDEADVERFGLRIDNIGTADEFSRAEYAQLSAQLQLAYNVSKRRKFTFRLSSFWAFLDPMDLIEIPDPTNWNSTIIVQIMSIEDDENEMGTYVALEWLQGQIAPSVLPTQPTDPPNQGTTNAPVNCVAPAVIFEPPADMLTATGFAPNQIIMGGTGTLSTGVLDPMWGGANVWVSLDGVDYSLFGELTGPSVIGPLTASLAAYGGANPDNTSTLAIDLTDCAGVLASVAPVVASTSTNLCIVQDASGFEILTYTTATLTGTHKYSLTKLYRGLFGTSPRLFGAGALFMSVARNFNFLEQPLPPQYIGHTLWIKFQSFNIYRNYFTPLEQCAAYQYLVGGSGPPPAAQLPVPRRRPLVWTEDEDLWVRGRGNAGRG